MEQDMEYYRRYLKGDADALGELMKLYRERLIFFAMEFLSSPDDAEEVAAVGNKIVLFRRSSKEGVKHLEF